MNANQHELHTDMPICSIQMSVLAAGKQQLLAQLVNEQQNTCCTNR